MPAFSLLPRPGLLTVPLHSRVERSPTDAGEPAPRSFGSRLSPVNYRRECARLVSYYALFKWWLLLSQHPSCHRTNTSFVTQPGFGTLAGGLGCFPFDNGAYPPKSDSQDTVTGIRSLARKGRLEAPTIPISVSTPTN